MARIMTPKQTCLHHTTDLNDGAMMLEIEPEDFRVEHFAKCLKRKATRVEEDSDEELIRKKSKVPQSKGSSSNNEPKLRRGNNPN